MKYSHIVNCNKTLQYQRTNINTTAYYEINWYINTYITAVQHNTKKIDIEWCAKHIASHTQQFTGSIFRIPITITKAPNYMKFQSTKAKNKKSTTNLKNAINLFSWCTGRAMNLYLHTCQYTFKVHTYRNR